MILIAAFQMAVDNDVLHKNPFGFELAGVVVNDSVTKEALTRDQMRKFLKFVNDDNVYCKYYEVVYILFHTGMRISEFCGLTIKDVDLENRIVNIEHQLQRLSDMTLVIEPTKTSAGTRKNSGNRGCCKMLSSHHRRPGETKGRKSGGWIYRVPVFG